MKKIILLCTFLLVVQLNAGVVNNSGSTGADSLTMNFYLLDSLGSMTTIATVDSLGLVIFYPEGAVAYSTTILGNNSQISSQNLTNIGTFYAYADAVSNLDGGSPSNGIYRWSLTVNDISMSLKTTHVGEFQLYDGADYNVRLDNIDAAISSRSNFDQSSDSVLAKANIVSISNDANAADSLEALVDGDSNFQLKLKQLYISNPDGSAIFATSQSTNGHGMYLEATQNGNGLYALNIGGGNGIKSEAGGSGNGHGMLLIGKGTGSDLNAQELIDISDSVNVVLNSEADSASIARAVWNSPQTNHITAGTFGDYLDTKISGIGSGSGIYAYTIIVYDTIATQTIPATNIVVRNLAQSSLIAVGRSDVNGQASFNLDAGSYLLIANSPGYIFESFDTVIVSGVGEDSLFGYQFDIGQPASPALCRLYGFLYDISGNPEKNVTVTAALPSGAAQATNMIISPFKMTTFTDTLGYFYIDLLPSDSLTPSNKLYEISITRKDGTIIRQRVTVPALANWQLTW